MVKRAKQIKLIILVGIVGAILLLSFLLLQIKIPVFGKTTVDLLVSNGTVLTMNSQKKIIPNGAVAVRDGKIIAVGLTKALEQAYKAKKIINASGGVIMPGLINAHTHTAMTLFRGFADDMPLMEWLQKYIFPAEKKHVTPEFVYWGTKLACYEMIKGGTTTFVDMYFFEDSVAQAAYEMGMRAIVGETIIEFPTPDSKNYKQALEQTKKLVEKWKNNPLITPAIAPHAPYTSSKEMLLAIKSFAEKYDVPVITHVCETKSGINQVISKHKMRPVKFLDSIGLLNKRLIAAHCVHLTDNEIALLAQKKVGVAHCPVSNMKLSSGIATVYKMLKTGVLVGLGTDGAASNNSLDMFGEMKTAALLQKVATGKPTALNAYQTLELATIGSARAIHMGNKIGSLEPGKKADIIVVAIDQIHQIPVYHVASQLVYASKAPDVQTVIINGKIIMRDRVIGTKGQEEELRKKVEHFKKSIVDTKNSE
ncbi:amidohydrolase [Candidatus Dependentiae bacterium]